MNEITKQQLLAIIGEEANIEVEIDQELYPKPDWAVGQIVRSSGLVEDICREHGIGHPNADWLRINDPNNETGLSIHGCCGCCSPGMKKAIKNAYDEKDQSSDEYVKVYHVTSDENSEPFQELWDGDLRKKVMREYDDRSNTPSIESGRCDKT